MNIFRKTINALGASLLGLFKTRSRAANGRRGYDGASKRPRTKNWYTGGTSPDAVIVPALENLRARVRYLIRNEGLAKKAMRTIATNLVGTGIIGESEEETFNAKQFNNSFELWATSRFCDYDNRRNLYGLQWLAVETLVQSGAVFVQKIIVPPSKTPPGMIPLRIRLLEPDYLDTNKTESIQGGGYIENGIQYDEAEQITGYWLYEKHPGNTFPFNVATHLDSRFMPIRDVEHIFIDDRPGQRHGVPWLESVVIAMKDYSDYEDAQLLRQKIANCFAAFVEDIEPPERDSDGKTEDLYDKIEPATIEFLPPGRKVNFAVPPGVQGYGEYTTGQKQRIAAGTSLLTYESLTGDLSRVNFSSARIGQQDMYAHAKVLRELSFIPQFCETVKNWFCDVAFISGVLRDPVVKVVWTPPAREFLEPVKDSQAANMRVQFKQESMFEMLRSRGKNPKKFLAQYAKEKEYVESLGLTFDTNAGNITNTDTETSQNEQDENKENNQNGNNAENDNA